jgi:hypothetical protein
MAAVPASTSNTDMGTQQDWHQHQDFCRSWRGLGN